jgi:hypothetical protein
MTLLLSGLALMAQADGQVGKFENRAPTASYVTVTQLEDVERCLIRFGFPPTVYRQPDRPDEATIVWIAGGVSAGNAAARVDLKRSDAGTIVKAWMSEKQVRSCAP